MDLITDLINIKMSKDTLKALINSNLPDNTSGAITPKKIRDVNTAIVDEMATTSTATTISDGLMSSSDKQKLDGMPDGGVKGDTGASAYEVAVAEGFVGTESEWLESLKGKDGGIDPSMAKAVIGKNLYNPDNAVSGYLDTTGGVQPNSAFRVSDFIPVSVGDNVYNHFKTAGANNCFYDANKRFLKAYSTNLATYVEGAAYYRGTVSKSGDDMIEIGSEPSTYEPYTDKADAIEIAKEYADSIVGRTQKTLLLDKSTEYAGMDIGVNNGLTREYGADFNNSASGFMTVRHKEVDKLTIGSVKYTVDLIVGNPIKETLVFANWEQSITQLGGGLYRFVKTVNMATAVGINRQVIIQSSTMGESYTNFRVSKITVDIQDADESELAGIGDNLTINKGKIFEICKDFTQETPDYGVTRFSAILDAYDLIDKMTTSGRYNTYNPPIVRIMPGVYDEFKIRWAGSDDETGGSYFGMNLRFSTVWESFDVDYPSLTKLMWDGSYGFSPDHTMTLDQALRRCIFHHVGNGTGAPCHSIVRGVHLYQTNTRYAFHADSSGGALNTSWTLDRCILEYDGVRACVGIGISPFEVGEMVNCRFMGSTNTAIGGHSNGFMPTLTEEMAVIVGGRLNVRNCNLNNKTATMDNLASSLTMDVPFTFDLSSCGNVSTLTFEEGWHVVTDIPTIIGEGTQDEYDALSENEKASYTLYKII